MEKQNRAVFITGDQIDLVVINQERHLPNIYSWINDQDVNLYLERPYRPASLADEKKWIEKAETGNDRDIILAIETKAGEHIGTIGLHGIDYSSRRANIGIMIGDKAKWKKGYATEAEKLLAEYAFRHLDLRKLCGLIFEENLASRRAAEKNGAVLEGTFKDHVFRNDKLHNICCYAYFNPTE